MNFKIIWDDDFVQVLQNNLKSYRDSIDPNGPLYDAIGSVCEALCDVHNQDDLFNRPELMANIVFFLNMGMSGVIEDYSAVIEYLECMRLLEMPSMSPYLN